MSSSGNSEGWVFSLFQAIPIITITASTHEPEQQSMKSNGDSPEQQSMKSDGETDEKPKAREEGEPSEEEQQEEPDASRLALLRNHQLRFSDAFDPNAERVDKIGQSDVIFGRGKGYQNHPGNVRMRDIIEIYKIQYHSLNRKKKRELLQAVYNEIIEDGARFLKKLDGEDAWVKVDADLALQKVSHTLRCRKSVIEKHIPESAIGDTPTSAQGVADSQMALHGNAPRRVLPLGMRCHPWELLSDRELSPACQCSRTPWPFPRLSTTTAIWRDGNSWCGKH
jgi:hypothetical protein